jgi:uncharacterized protein YfdQ (DUF2303 family)
VPDITSDTAAALLFAEDHTLTDCVLLGDHRLLVRRRAGETWEPHDTFPTHAPRRSTGIVCVYDAPSFVAALDQRGTGVVYADEEMLALVAVLNDDRGDEAGWRDYQIRLTLRATEEWSGWKYGQGLGSQQRFAERIEEGLPEIVDPPGADMLELAQTFHASVDVKYRSGHRLANGQTQFTYAEDIKASAGSQPGTITIPETFTLGVAPFLGLHLYEVTARLRYRLSGGDLQIGYQLVRPEAVERDAFGFVVDEVRSAVGDTVFLNGPAPTPAAAP